MNKFILTAIAAACFAGVAAAQDEKKVTIPPPANPVQEEYNQLLDKWIIFNNGDKDAAYSVFNEIYEKIRAELPMSPELQKAIAAIREQERAALTAKAKEMGFDNYKDVWGKGDPTELELIMKDFSMRESALTAAYNDEFNRKYQLACIDAVKRLLENAEAMK